MTLPLAEWIEQQAAISARKLAGAVSATHLTFHRPGFGQVVRPAKGSVLASPETALGDGPDYFFHWIRDAAAVMEAIRLLAVRGPDAADWAERFDDCVRFSLALGRLSGADVLRSDVRARVKPDFQKFVRAEAEIAAVSGERVLGDVRYGADGTLDFIKWARPQHDGAALEALVAIRFWRDGRSTDASLRAALEELIRRDLDYSARHIADPCVDICEDERGEHYYPRLVQCVALDVGAAWIAERGDAARAGRYREAAERLAPVLDGFWSAADGFYRSRLPAEGVTASKALDLSTILAVLHAGRARGAHSVLDERVAETLRRLKSHFAGAYPINHVRGIPFALGRYPGDRYFDGSAWYLASFAAAEYEYRRAHLLQDRALVAHGDAILEAVRTVIPPAGELSEQFHPTTGAPLSARNLTWSYAAFVTAWDARKEALGA
jgi:glucoamylase